MPQSRARQATPEMAGRCSTSVPLGGATAVGVKREEHDPLVGIGTDTAVLPLKWVGLIILLECALSLSINFYNSWLLRFLPGFTFPLTYTEVTVSMSFLGAGILIRVVRAAPLNWQQAQMLLPQISLLALLRGISISTNNYSLRCRRRAGFESMTSGTRTVRGSHDHAPPWTDISLGLNKVIKASAPIFTVLTSVLFEDKT